MKEYTNEQSIYVLKEEGARRYPELLKISVSLAFGALVFLLTFESNFVKEDNECNLLIFAAWWLFAVASLSGFLSYWEWAADPYRRAILAEKPSPQMIQKMEGKTYVVIPEESSTWHEIVYRLHFSSFLLGFVAIVIYKAINTNF
jgi:hypothetical protein